MTAATQNATSVSSITSILQFTTSTFIPTWTPFKQGLKLTWNELRRKFNSRLETTSSAENWGRKMDSVSYCLVPGVDTNGVTYQSRKRIDTARAELLSLLTGYKLNLHFIGSQRLRRPSNSVEEQYEAVHFSLGDFLAPLQLFKFLSKLKHFLVHFRSWIIWIPKVLSIKF